MFPSAQRTAAGDVNGTALTRRSAARLWSADNAAVTGTTAVPEAMQSCTIRSSSAGVHP
jgi:hypothetical protein